MFTLQKKDGVAQIKKWNGPGNFFHVNDTYQGFNHAKCTHSRTIGAPMVPKTLPELFHLFIHAMFFSSVNSTILAISYISSLCLWLSYILCGLQVPPAKTYLYMASFCRLLVPIPSSSLGLVLLFPFMTGQPFLKKMHAPISRDTDQ